MLFYPSLRPTVALFVLVCSTALYGQEVFDLEWGEIPHADLEMTTYAFDSTAEAVVLDDRGSMRVVVRPTVIQTVLEVHRRIKILQPAGLHHADIELAYSKAGMQNIRGVRAQVVHADDQGEPVVLKQKDFFKEERGDGYIVLKAALPNAQVGSVIELVYTYTDESALVLPSWDFQREIPVRRSLLKYDFPREADYIRLWRGTEPTAADVDGSDGSRVYSRSDYILAEQMPGLTEEPYISTMEDYRLSLSFQLRSVSNQFGEKRQILSSWGELGADLYESGLFGEQYTKRVHHKRVLEAAAPALRETEGARETIEAAYRFVADAITDNGAYGYFADKNLDAVLKAGTGSEAEMSLMLIAILRAEGLPADPVLLSSRSHGKPYPFYPMLRQFDRMIVRTEVDGEPLFLDLAEATTRPVGLLRHDALNGVGWRVADKHSEWIKLPSPTQKETVVVNCTLTPDGAMEGNVLARFTDYAAQQHHEEHMSEATKSNWSERLTTYREDLEIELLEAKDAVRTDNKFETRFNFTADETTDSELLYVPPVLYSHFDENPFALEARYFPVDLACPFTDKYIYTLQVPEGYAVEALPESVKVNLPDGGGRFTYVIGQSGNTIKLTCLIQVKQTLWTPDEYGTIKNFFNLIAEKQGEQIVLKKA